jgi:hypothetical protein
MRRVFCGAMPGSFSEIYAVLPVRFLPLSKVDPPRNVRAEDWRGAFCGEWTDGCKLCSGGSRGSPICKSDSAAECPRHSIRCLKNRDDAFIYCRRMEYLTRRYFADGRIRDDPAWSNAHWEHTATGYALELQSEAIVRQRSKYNETQVRSEVDIRCLDTYAR